nr:immunoglobulin heavy chain junction region [Macaca mulatta]MOV45269.1 immunoglobulin heavy chain junction region [Macaca mulatta]
CAKASIFGVARPLDSW